MYGGDAVFNAKVQCPVCFNIWKERIAADLVGVTCQQCKTFLVVKSKFTLEEPDPKHPDIFRKKKYG